jgi:hypothetical protein
MADKNIITYRYTFTDKTMTGNLAVLADFGAFLYFYECTDLAVVTNLASVQIHKITYLNVLT